MQKALLILLLLVLSVCLACSENRQPVSRSLSSVNTQTLNAVQPTPQKSNTAVVISQQANLRDGKKSSANVIQTVALDSEVEVIKQQGAWYYVKVENDIQGWMHGNTLRLQNYDISPPVSRQTPKPQPRTTPEPEINNSGATAKCRDSSLSYSAHRRGTCSHHGGVAVWY